MKTTTRLLRSSRPFVPIAGIAPATFALLLSLAPSASAQTWVGGRTTPRLDEIVAIDATGEPNWPFGTREDIAGDGLATYDTPEKRIDMRSAYAATDTMRFWTRIYAVDTDSVSPSVKVFVFIDTDNDASTGGSAAAMEIDPRFTMDPTDGGYDKVLELDATGTILRVWSWQIAVSVFTSAVPMTNQIRGEAGKDIDPVVGRNSTAGYVEAQIDLGLVDLTTVCDARLFYRTINTATPAHSDLDVGLESTCVPMDANNDGVPDILVPPAECTSDADCPAGGVCDAGECVLPIPCLVDTDCNNGFTCSSDGRCLPPPGGQCTVASDCGDLACINMQCVACTLGSNDCGSGMECTPQGTCVVATGGGGGDVPVLGPGERLQGGALACASASGSRGAGDAWAAFVLAFAGLALGARRKPTNASRSSAN